MRKIRFERKMSSLSYEQWEAVQVAEAKRLVTQAYGNAKRRGDLESAIARSNFKAKAFDITRLLKIADKGEALSIFIGDLFMSEKQD